MDGRELLKRYDAYKQEAMFLRDENRWLRGDRDHYRRECYFTQQRINVLKERVEKFEAENSRLLQQVKELSAAPEASRENLTPDWVKPSVHRRRKKPGCKKGHVAALRAMPDHIDVHHDALLPVDGAGRESCPRCNACLLELADHNRIVEDIIPEKVVVKCYHTRSGWCPGCRRRVENRAPDQPPAANLPHGQLGINALASGIVLRVTHRLPFRQVARVLADLQGLSISHGAIAKQVQRAAGWFAEDYDKLLLELRSSPQVYADETGWRTNGRN